MPDISVIVPIYNVCTYLGRCINSVLSQTFTDFEIILVDDGSPDNCGRINDTYAKIDSRIKVIHKANGGLSDARNMGLEIADGKYVYFIDPDDYIDKNLFEYANPYLNKGCQLFSFSFIFEYDDKPSTPFEYFVPQSYYVFNSEEERLDFITEIFMRFGIGFGCCMKIFDRELIENNRIRFIDTKRVCAEDICFDLFFLVHCNKIYASDKHFYHYYQRKSSIMSENRKHLNIRRFNELAKEVYNYYFEFSKSDYFCDNFPLIYLSIFDHLESNYRQNVDNISAKELKRMIYSEIEDISFFRKNLRGVNKYKKYIYKDKPKAFVLYRLNELNYYAGSSFLSFWIKTKLLNIFLH